MQTFDNIDALIDRMEYLCHADFCRMLLVVGWNM